MATETPERYRRIAAIFDEALKLAPERRAEYLGAACGGDVELHRQVVELLEASRSAGDFLERPVMPQAVEVLERMADGPLSGPSSSPADTAATVPPPVKLPKIIGDYRILRKIGEGGMGVVYEAEQQNPRRAVALKVIRGGAYIDDQAVRLFRREAQALARLKHPGIAAIYESGRTEDGQHFFAMELVRGEDLAVWAGRRSVTGSAEERAQAPVPAGRRLMTPLDVRERLALFRKVCDAVSYAHQRGVIHRDLKPSNVLVQREAVVRDPGGPGSSGTGSQEPAVPDIKILDFGLARITDSDVAMSTVVTEVGRVLGTLPYMSPEQVRGNADEIDLRSDVYSLGVILYEMIAGRLPLEVQGRALPEAMRVICEEPPRPLTSTFRGAKRLDTDLGTIVQKALEKEPARRYHSAAALSEDLRRYLADLPILARPPSAVYQFRKLVMRHKGAFGFMAALFVVLLGVAVTMSVQAGRIARARDRADREARTANQALEFLTGLFKVSDPSQARGNTMTAREVLDRGAKRLDTELTSEPVIQAKLMETIGEVYINLGLNEQAAPLLERSLALRRKNLNNDHPDTLASINDMGLLLKSLGKLKEAEPFFREALEGRRRVLGNDHPDTLVSIANLGILLQGQGKLEEAETYYREALEGRRHVLGNDHPDTLASINNMGFLLQSKGRLEDVEPYYREALEGRRRVLGNDHPSTLGSIYNMGILLAARGMVEQAEPYFREALAGHRRVLGNDHPNTLVSIANLGILLEQQGKLDEAAPYYDEALKSRRRVLGNDHPSTLSSLNNMGALLESRGKLKDAEVYYRDALQGRRRVLGEDHPDTLESTYNVGLVLHKQGKLTEAEPYYRQALEGNRRVLGGDHPNTLTSINGMGLLLEQRGELKEAESYIREALQARRRVLGNGHPDTLDSMVSLGSLQMAQGHLEGAERLLKDAVAGTRALPAGHPNAGAALCAYGRCLKLLKRYPDAEAALLEAETILVSADAELDREARGNLVALYEAWGRPKKAAAWRAKASQP